MKFTMRRLHGSLIGLNALLVSCGTAPPIGSEYTEAPGSARSDHSDESMNEAGSVEPTLDPGVSRAIKAGLDWLRRHQDADGKWDCDDFAKHTYSEGDALDDSVGAGNPTHDVGVTGLALLALIAGDSGPHSDEDLDRIRRAAEWLCIQQHPDTGLIPMRASHEYIYDQAIATWALARAEALVELPPYPDEYGPISIPDGVRLGVRYLESHRNPTAAWRYEPQDGQNDTSVTTWCLLALAAARQGGHAVDQAGFDRAADWVDSVTAPETGRIGYISRGDGIARRPGKHELRFPRERSESATAAGLCVQSLTGRFTDESVLARSLELVASKPPIWDPTAAKIDFVAWFLGTRALRLFGGAHSEDWEWKLTATLTGNQHGPGDRSTAGSWDPLGPWGEDGGRVMATALGVMSLQARFDVRPLER